MAPLDLNLFQVERQNAMILVKRTVTVVQKNERTKEMVYTMQERMNIVAELSKEDSASAIWIDSV